MLEELMLDRTLFLQKFMHGYPKICLGGVHMDTYLLTVP